MDELTLDEAKAIINAQNNLLNEIRARWMVLYGEPNDETRELNRAWMTLGAKPFSQRFFDDALPALQGKFNLYPEPVNANCLKSALIKMNGAERK